MIVIVSEFVGQRFIIFGVENRVGNIEFSPGYFLLNYTFKFNIMLICSKFDSNPLNRARYMIRNNKINSSTVWCSKFIKTKAVFFFTS